MNKPDILDGHVGKTKKVLHIYRDAKHAINPNHKTDVFVEVYPIDKRNVNTLRKLRYNNKLKKELANNNNVNLHYIDIRAHYYTEIESVLDKIEEYINDLNAIKESNTTHHLFNLEDGYKLLESYIVILYNKILKPQLKQRLPVDMLIDKNLINEINNNYKNKQLKKHIDNFMNSYIKSLFFILLADLKDEIDKIRKYQKSNRLVSDIISQIYESFYKIGDATIFAMGHLADFYFLKLFLDDDNIQNAVLYTGSTHADVYIHFLKIYYKFTINSYNTR